MLHQQEAARLLPPLLVQQMPQLLLPPGQILFPLDSVVLLIQMLVLLGIFAPAPALHEGPQASDPPLLQAAIQVAPLVQHGWAPLDDWMEGEIGWMDCDLFVYRFRVQRCERDSLILHASGIRQRLCQAAEVVRRLCWH
ncbi:MAG: hypothetical protein GY832_08310 [Chloroflexi bacterium]|nr:hypothetical protein [Chloroflexota bacterium]